MKRLFVLLSIVILLFPIAVTQAQTPILIESADIEIWPEYDQPSVLVIEHIRLDSTVKLPAEVTLRIPISVEEPYTLATREADGQLYNLEHKVEAGENWRNVIFTTPSAEIQLEYYDKSLMKNGVQRSFVYTWLGDYDIRGGSVSVQKPFSASTMTAQPDFGEPLQKQDGLTYYLRNLPALKADEKLEVTIAYEKPDDTLTFTSDSAKQVQPSEPEVLATGNSPQVWIWIVGIILIVGLLTLLVILIRSKGDEPQKRSTRVRRRSRQATEAEEYQSADVFCSQCGKKAGSSDVFCRSCGAKLRKV
ncbi:MAG TPA: zinc ribbon domain-containing protein [Bellilinea sp.]|nr:zinc ribbon domain-containing protein [Bellilinea sp.]